MGRYSYSQPSDSSHYSRDEADSGYNETEELIGRDQAELELKYPEPSQYQNLVSDLAKKSFTLKIEFEVCVGVMLFVLVVLGLVIGGK
ncbi:hypothetical protein YC2023_100414 [Brassica napus]